MAIVSSNVKIYTDSACTHLLKTVNGNTSAAQSIVITDLSEHTDYWAKAFATNSDSMTGESAAYPFQTLWNKPVVQITATNVTETTATLTFTYTGNYPIDTSNYSDVWGYYGPLNGQQTTVQWHDLANGTPEVIQLNGLTPNTTYTASMEVQYYTGEDNPYAAINFTTGMASPTVQISSVSDISSTGATVNITIS